MLLNFIVSWFSITVVSFDVVHLLKVMDRNKVLHRGVACRRTIGSTVLTQLLLAGMVVQSDALATHACRTYLWMV